MTDLNRAVLETADFEGFRTAPYKDTRGFWTVGEGRCLETSPLTGPEFKYLLDSGLLSISMTQLGARHLTEQRLSEVDAALRAHLPWFAAAPDAVQTILVEMGYQLGVDSLLKFGTFLGLIQSGKFATAAQDGRTTLWYRQTTHRAEALMKRLEAT
jgi:lysozyme